MGLLGFWKEVEGVRKSVLGKEEEVQKLVDERVDVRKQIAFGRQLLDVEARLSVLEERLMVESAGKFGAATNGDAVDISDSETSDEDEDETRQFMSISKLRKHVHQYLLIRKLLDGIGIDHPFLVAQEPRLIKLRNTLLLDLSTAFKQAKGAGAAGLDRTMKIMGIYRHMDEATEAIKVLKSLRN